MIFNFLKKSTSKNRLPKSSGPVLKILDECAGNFRFPMLDNGYLYLAATRLTAYSNNNDWALVFEIFGFSPRAGIPDLTIQTFASNLTNRAERSDYATKLAYDNYLKNNPNNEFKSFYPIENDDWMSEESCEVLKPSGDIVLRGKNIALPSACDYKANDIALEESAPLTFELCRYLAKNYRENVLATEDERRFNVLNELKFVLTLDDWLHPDLTDGVLPSQTTTFSEIQDVLLTADATKYIGDAIGNTHWSNWPDGGIL